MKKLALASISLMALVHAAENSQKSAVEFAIYIPSYNNRKYCEANLISACFQQSTNPYHIYYVNDCSNDGTGEAVENFVKKYKLEEKVTVIHNTERCYGGANIYNTVNKYIPDDKVVVVLDGDDVFSHNNVLTILEKYYNDSHTWMTHGRLKKVPSGIIFGQAIPNEAFEKNELREKAFMTALRTFKASLFKKIRKEDLMYEGSFMRVTHDTAFMLAMLEMCSPVDGTQKSHCVYVDEILYYYWVMNPINDFRVNTKPQNDVDIYVRSQSRLYQPLERI